MSVVARFCTSCGSAGRDGASFCAACGGPLDAPSQVERSAGAASMAPDDQRQAGARPAFSSVMTGAHEASASPPASLGDRALAQLVDALVGFGVFFLVGRLIGARFGGATGSGFELSGGPAIAALAIVTAVMVAYFVGAETLLGATFGKLVAGIRVRSTDGGPIRPRAALVRNVLRLIDGIALYLVGVIAVLLSRRKQRLGDLAARTVVIRHETGRPVRVGALVAACAVAVGGIVGGFALGASPSETTAAGGAVPAVSTTTRDRGAVTTPRGAPVVATLARDVSANSEPISPATTFPPDVQVIHLPFEVKEATAGSRLRSVWIGVNVGPAAPPNTTIDEATLTLPGPSRGSFRLRRGPQPWPVGDYKVEVYLDDRLVVTLPFKIVR